MRRLLLALLVALLALPLAACGGGEDLCRCRHAARADRVERRSSPKTAPFLLRLNTAWDSAQWTVAERAAREASRTATRCSSGIGGEGVDFEQDVKPALGPETDLFALNGADLSNKVFLGANQPTDETKFHALLAKDKTPPVTEEIDGWQVISDKRETIDRYKVAKRSGTLDGQRELQGRDRVAPGGGARHLYVDGPDAQPRAGGAGEDRTRAPAPVPGVGPDRLARPAP